MPPAPARRAARATLSDELRDLIDRDGRTPHALALAAGVSPACLSRFLAGSRGLTTDTLDALAAAMGLHLSAARRPRASDGRKPARARREAMAGPSLAPGADPGAGSGGATP